MTDILKEKHSLFVKYMGFHEDLLKVQVKNMQHLIAIVPFERLNEIDVAERLAEGKHIITTDTFLMDDKDVEFVYEQVLPVIRKYHASDHLVALEDMYDKRRINMKSLALCTIHHDDHIFETFSSQYNLPITFLQKMSEILASPYLELCSEFFMKSLNENHWNRHFCPVCGNQPSMGCSNDMQNHRLLWCHICSTEWQFELDTCPFCLNTNLDTLKYIFPPDRSPHRIDVCDSCHHYLKTIDGNIHDSQSNFTIDYLSTYPLDVLAIKNGYHH